MTKHLQVILQDSEWREIQHMARSRHLSLAEWVRQALDLARGRESVGSISKKLEVIRAAAQNEYPGAIWTRCWLRSGRVAGDASALESAAAFALLGQDKAARGGQKQNRDKSFGFEPQRTFAYTLHGRTRVVHQD